MKWIKAFVKDLKRSRWPSTKTSTTYFGWTLVFIIVTSLALFGLAIVLGLIWGGFGIGV